MTDRWQQVETLYHAARARPAALRGAFVREACAGDEGLQREVESLLAQGAASGEFLETPAAPGANAPVATLAPGAQVGVYRIEAAIGAGGMGEVYRARDTQLGRDVAIKVLPSHLVGDADRRARFEREARLLATLNHPHIAQIYGLEQAGDVRALVMEFAPGRTLAEIISGPSRPDGAPDRTADGRSLRSRGPGMAMAEVLRLAHQIADALDAAHEKGIIHRDLKPANVKVTPDGAVKVLDFGLAKAAEGGPDLSHVPTFSSDGTRDGMILGTPAYMSPEQARGKPVDRRTDIWAFGCLLYEMLTARPPFPGETISDTIAAVLEREPDWTALPTTTPAPIRRLLQRCLDKDLKRRLRDIGDARSDLDEAVVSGPAASHDANVVHADVPRLPGSVPAAWRVAALAVGAALALAMWHWVPQLSTGRPGVITRLTFDSGVQTDPALSPDGRSVAYTSNKSGNFDIWVQPVDGGNPVQVTTDAAHDWQPSWSQDGTRLVFRSERGSGGLFVVPSTGGTEEKLSNFGYQPRFSPDGTRILFTAGNPGTGRGLFYTIGLDPTPLKPRVVAELNPPTSAAWGWDPNGHATILSTAGAPQFTLRLSSVDLDRGTTVPSNVDDRVQRAFRELALAARPDALAWDPHGTALYFVGDSGEIPNLWMINIDPGTRAVIGGPHPVTTTTEGTTTPTISRDGLRLAFGGVIGNARLWSYPLDGSGSQVGAPHALTPAEMSADALNLTPDGSKLLFRLHRPGSSQLLEWRERAMPDGPERHLLSDDPRRGADRDTLIWSPDDTRIVYRHSEAESQGEGLGTRRQSLRVLDTRTGADTQLTSPVSLYDFPTGWSADGLSVLTCGMRYKDSVGHAATALGFSTITLVRLSEAPTAENAVRIVASSPDYTLDEPRMSPNGRWVGFLARKVSASQSQIMVIASGGGKWTPVAGSSSWDDKPRWSADGRVLYFLSNRGGLFNVWAARFDPVAGQQVGEPFRVTHFDGPGERILPSMIVADLGVGPNQLVIPIVNPAGHISMLDNFAGETARPTWLWLAILVMVALPPVLLESLLEWRLRARRYHRRPMK